MSDKLGLSYLTAAQAQKHITVNETFRRLDALVQASAIRLNINTPPASPINGATYGIGLSPTDLWATHPNEIAVFQDGAWSFIVPKTGFRLFDEEQNKLMVWQNNEWRALQTSSGNGGGNMASGLPQGLSIEMKEINHVVVSGSHNDTSLIIPDKALVLGITGRVTQAIIGVGSNLKWKVGVSDDDGRYASQIDPGLNSHFVGVSGTPTVYYANTAVRITTQNVGDSFTSGVIKLRLYILTLQAPASL